MKGFEKVEDSEAAAMVQSTIFGNVDYMFYSDDFYLCNIYSYKDLNNYQIYNVGNIQNWGDN